MKQKIKDFANRILDLMYPKNIKCMFCTEELNQNDYNCTCDDCREILPFITNPCLRCGSQMSDNNTGVCSICKKRNLDFVQAKSVFEYVDKPRDVVQLLKYNNKKFLVEHIVKYMLDEFGTWSVFPDFVTYVPMFETKEKERGYNQAKLMAEEFSKKAKLPFATLIAKVVDSPSQTSLSTLERIENVKGSFAILPENKKMIKNKTILIIDDVITTGATASEVSRVLKENGAKECFVLTFAHTQIEDLSVED